MVTGNFLGGPTTGAVTIIAVFLLGDGPWVRLLPFLVNFLSTDVQFPLYSIGWKYRFNMYSILLCNVKYKKKKMALTRPNLHTHKYPDHAIERTELATLMASLESHMECWPFLTTGAQFNVFPTRLCNPFGWDNFLLAHYIYHLLTM